MTTQFPGAYDDFLNPTSGTQLSATGYKHHQHHTDLNDAVEAIEHSLGVGSTVTGVSYSLISLSGQVSTLSGVVTTGMEVLSSVTTTVSGLVVTVSGTTSGAPASGTYLTLSTLSGAPARVFTPGAALSGTDAGSGSTYTLRVYPTGVSSGTYYKPTITTNAQGQLTFVSDAGAGDGFIRGLPTSPRTLASFWFGDYVPTYDKVYFNTKVLSGALYYIDRTTDYYVQIGTISGKTPGVWVYSSILTGFVMSNSTSSGFICTITGGSVVGTTLGMDGGACVRTTVSGKTIYTNAIGNTRVEIYDPATTSVTNTLTSGAGGTDGRSIIFVSGADSVYSIRRTDGDIFKIYCPTTGSVTVSGGIGGASLGSRCSIAYNLNANKAFCCGAGQQKVWYFTPATGSGAETVTTLNFPTGYPASDGAYGAYSIGNYVYFMTNTTMCLVLDAVNLTWKFPLNVSESASALTYDKANFIAGIAAEGVLYVGVSIGATVGYVSYGRY